MTAPLDDQIHEYADHIDRVTAQITAREALSYVDAVRIADEPTVGRSPRWRNVAIVGGVAVLLLVVLATPFLFGRWIEPGGNAGDTVTSTGATPTTVSPSAFPPGATVVRDTELGTWTWTRLDVPQPWSLTWFDDRFWTLESDRGLAQPSTLLVSSDGIDWDALELPAAMKGYSLFLIGQEDELYMAGVEAGSFSEPTVWRYLGDDQWESAPASVLGFGGAMPVDGFTGEGVDIVGHAGERTRVGDVVLNSGSITVDLPAEVNAVVGGNSWAEGSEDASGTVSRFGYEDDDGLRYEVTMEREGATLAVIVWDGLEEDGKVLHEATVTAPDAATAERIVRTGSFPAWVPTVWRSDDGGDSFSVAAGPFDDLLTTAPEGWIGDGWVGTVAILERDGRFLAYGRVPGVDASRTVAPTVGAVATSQDGLSWQTSLLPELVDPSQVFAFGDSVVWEVGGPNSSLWMSRDGLTGEVVPIGEAGGVMAVGDLLLYQRGTSFMISRDGKTWAAVAPPETSSNGYGIQASGNRVFYIVERGVDVSDSVTWMGTFDG